MFQFIRELNMIYAEEKPANGSVSGHINTDMPIYKSFEFIDNSQELKRLAKNKKTTTFEHSNRKKNVESVFTSKKGDNKVFKNQEKEANHFMNWENPKNVDGSVKIPTSESEGSRKKIDHKREMEVDYDMPEMVAFVQESSNYNHLLNDIIMETQDSINQDEWSNENYELDHYNFSSSIVDSDTESIDSTKETLQRLHCIANELEFITSDFKNEVDDYEDFDERDDVLIDHSDGKIVHKVSNDIENEQNCYEKLTKEDENDFNGRDIVSIQFSAEKIVQAIQLIKEVQEDCNANNQQYGYKRLTKEEEEHFEGRDNMKTDNSGEIVSTVHLTKEMQKEAAALSNPTLPSTTEAAYYNCPTNDTCESEEETTNSKNCEQTCKTESLSSTPQMLTSSSPTLTNQDDDRESSNPSSGHLEQSMRSSISLHSSTSGHSFAFPILTPEWPESPVHIGVNNNKRWRASVNRRQLQRRPRWRALVCCKFVK